MPPPSSGGTALVEMLSILEGFDLAALGHNTAPYLHHLAETMRLAFRDRARHLADADFVDVPIAELTSEEYAVELRSKIDPQHAGVSSPADAEHALVDESEQTTHYSVVDATGLAVSVTYTIEQGYGSKITVPGAGFLLNNQMGDFNAGPGITDTTGLIGTEPNLARPEQRMLSSMSPSIVTRDGQLVAVIGTPGGRTIINTVLQVFLNLVDFGMSPVDAITAPRMHHQWLPNRIDLEEGFEDEALVAALNAMGHSVRVRGSQGTAHSIFIEPGTGWLIAVPDPRGGDAAAAGY